MSQKAASLNVENEGRSSGFQLRNAGVFGREFVSYLERNGQESFD